jgi:hypothetical protein
MTKNSYYQDIQDAIAIYARDVLARGQEEERERIIKLLETNTPNNHGLTTLIMNWVVAEGNDPTVQDCADFAAEIVALIKGENK